MTCDLYRDSRLETAATLGAPAARDRRPPAASSSPAAQLRPLALPALRQSDARCPPLHRRATLHGSLRFFMTSCANPLSRLAPTHVFTPVCPKHQVSLQNHSHRRRGTARAHPAHVNRLPLFISIGEGGLAEPMWIYLELPRTLPARKVLHQTSRGHR